ncbi:hypothetical protein H6F93_05955 [Leptolyngbya sp. FACHB-671]|uniref:hypothetical protein n=1 Tax=Leptolyngbya sp. FACHB-671 TaxID=2692812 RepID=UPI001684075D|nr:hypothetical protein [Leptolyngbya sp. FACHB-671]MBD2067075.1 hypothetical protein [Leptolyngbya sp. FACHB-671]
MSTPIRSFKSFAVGFPLVFLCLAAFTGGLSNAFWLLAASVVCTAGIGLIIWIPLSLVTGWAALTLAKEIANTTGISSRDGAVRNAAERTEASIRQQAMRSSSPHGVVARTVSQNTTPQERIALDEYIRRAVRLGHPYERILATLTEQGWKEAEIHQAFQVAANQ